MDLQVLNLRWRQVLGVRRIIIIEHLPREDTVDFWMCLKRDDGVGLGEYNLVVFGQLDKTWGSRIDISYVELRCILYSDDQVRIGVIATIDGIEEVDAGVRSYDSESHPRRLV